MLLCDVFMLCFFLFCAWSELLIYPYFILFIPFRRKVLSSGADTIASSEGTGAAIRAQFRLPGGAKATEKFSTEDDVLSVVRAIAQQVRCVLV